MDGWLFHHLFHQNKVLLRQDVQWTINSCLIFLHALQEANQILNGNKEYRTDLLTMAAKLPPMQIGNIHNFRNGWKTWMIRKMNIDMFSTYTDFIQESISPYSTPELFEAARNSRTIEVIWQPDGL